MFYRSEGIFLCVSPEFLVDEETSDSRKKAQTCHAFKPSLAGKWSKVSESDAHESYGARNYSALIKKDRCPASGIDEDR